MADRHGYTDDGQGAQGSQHARQVGGSAGASATAGLVRERCERSRTCAVRRHDADFVGHVELGERLGRPRLSKATAFLRGSSSEWL